MAYATLAQLRQYLAIPIERIEDDDLLQACLDRAQSYIDEETRRHFETVTETRFYHAERDVTNDGTLLVLDKDLLTLTTATDGDGDCTSDCVLLPTNHDPKYAIERIDETWNWDDTPHEAIEIEGTWGYSATAPNDVVQATIRLAAYLYKQKDASAVDVATYYEGGVLSIPQGVPQYVALVIGRYTRRQIG